jgi:CHAT domain-containing protein
LTVYPIRVSKADLTQKIEGFRVKLANRDYQSAQAGRHLYDLLLGPALPHLEGISNLIISPDGPLWELAFQALQSADRKYLIERVSISYAPSLTVLREMMKLARDRSSDSTQKRSPLLAFGNPALAKKTTETVRSVLMDEKLGPLPEAEYQVRRLGELYGPADSLIYCGADAREDRAKAEAGRYRIVHFATHGILNDASPMYSQILLATTEGEGAEDGLLEAWEIMKLDLRADLVVLSACETARGRVGDGEGVVGLSWALFVAGAPTSVVSQWKVEAASTAELMVGFHRRFRSRLKSARSRLTSAEALRQAALKLLRSEQYKDPFYWAGFVIIGDAR